MRNKKYYTAPEVAEFCGCDLKTIHNWFERGQIKGFRTPGRHLRFTAQNVTTFLFDNNFPPLEEGTI